MPLLRAESNVGDHPHEILQMVLDTIPARVFWKDRSSVFAGCNKLFAQDAGCDSSAQVVGKTDFDFGWRDQAESYRQDDRSVIESGQAKLNYEELQTTPAGRQIWLRTSKIPWREPGGAIIGVLGVYEDITEHKQALLNLHRNQAELVALYEHAPVIMLLVDSEGRALRANRAAAALAGRAAEELIGERVGEVLGCVHRRDDPHGCGFGPDCGACTLHRAIQDTLCDRAAHSRFFVKPSLVCRGERRNATLLASAARVVVGGEVMALLCLQDLTERQRAEERIREQAALLDIAHDAITVFDLEGRALYWNNAAERLYGWPVEEALGRSVNQLFFEEVPPEFIQALEAVLKYGEWNGELRQTNKDRKPVVVQSRATLVRDAAGKPKSMLFVSTDVTEKKALEAKFLRVQRLETIGALASGIAHDLNNVLSPISMAVDMLRLRLRDEQDQMLLQVLATSAQRGAGIVRQLLTFGRGVEATRTRLKPKLLLKEIAKIIEETFPKSIQLRVELDDDIWEIIGDTTQIHQVLLNLCVNARDAMPEGGTLTLAAHNVRLDRRGAGENADSHAGPHVVLEVADTGSGMTPEVLGKIYAPFFTTKPVGKGTGLGLSTARDIIRSHNGFVEVWSEPGKGTRFTVYFPAPEVQTAETRRVGPAPLPLGHGQLVLVADDEQSVLKLAKHILETHGYRVLTAGDGREALAAFSHHVAAIRAVIIDLMMPNLGGAATIKTLRTHNPHLPIIAISGAPPHEAEAHEQETAEIAFLPKPFTVQHLLTALNNALGGTASS